MIREGHEALKATGAFLVKKFVEEHWLGWLVLTPM
jgi:hypothetical protein